MNFRISRRRTIPIVRWSRNLLLSLGILALAYCGFVLLDARLYQANQTQRFQQALKDSRPIVDGPGRSEPTAPLDSGPAIAESAPVQTRDSAGAGFPLGRIEISRLGLAAMIQTGTDEMTLKRAVGHFPETPLPGWHGNVALAGHRDTYFRALRDIRVDDEITLTTLDGSFRYRVAFTKVVSADAVYVLAGSDDPILTLVTCYPFHFVGPAPQRFIVRAHMIAG